MRTLDECSLKEVSGAAQITADYVSVVSPSVSSYEHMFITFNNDGTLPQEFQDKINNGATWEEMAPWLTMYSLICELHPELFQ